MEYSLKAVKLIDQFLWIKYGKIENLSFKVKRRK